MTNTKLQEIQELSQQIDQLKSEMASEITSEIDSKYAELLELIKTAKECIPEYKSPLESVSYVPKTTQTGRMAHGALQVEIINVLSTDANQRKSRKDLTSLFPNVTSNGINMCIERMLKKAKPYNGFFIKMVNPQPVQDKSQTFIKVKA